VCVEEGGSVVGRPLVSYNIRAAQRAKTVSRI